MCLLRSTAPTRPTSLSTLHTLRGMLRQSLLLPGLLALSLYSSSATGQYMNSSVGPDFDIPHTVLRRLSLSDAGLTLRDIYESDQARVGWLYESAVGREDDPSNPTAGFLNTRADQSDDIKVDNAVVRVLFFPSNR
jgi:hypothetical protein